MAQVVLEVGGHMVERLCISRPPAGIFRAGRGGRICYIEAKRREVLIRRILRASDRANVIAFPIMRRVRR